LAAIYRGGQAVFDDYHRNWWSAAAKAFESGNEELALETTIDWLEAQGAVFNGEALSWGRLPDDFRQLLRDNINDLRVMVTFSDAFPGPSRDEVNRIDCPILLLSGERTISVHRLIDGELERTLRRCNRVVIRDARHEMWPEQPDECRRQAIEFFLSISDSFTRGEAIGR
jgi:pimeloyl-ACP methyl ester carboxylesterase